ncbi:MAG: dihydrofolate reductase family protein, partial [Dehalococcoidia bacterium]
DPDGQGGGRGRRALETAGIAVTVGDGADEVNAVLAGYLKHRRTGLPLVVVKFAASLDGRIAAASGDSRWVSGPQTLAWAHRERQYLDAIVVGSGTVVVDDPTLTARPGGTTEGVHQPLRVVVDSRGRTPEHASVLTGPSPTLIATGDRSPPAW